MGKSPPSFPVPCRCARGSERRGKRGPRVAVIDDGPEVRLRNGYDAALRRRHRRRAHLLLAARRVRRRGHRAPAPQHRPADLRRWTPHRVPARHLRVRALGRLAPARLVLPARLPVLQHRAAEPALRAPRRGARARAARARGRGARRSTSAAVERAWEAYARAHPAPRARARSASSRELWRLRERQSEAFGRNVRREAEKKAIETARYVIPIACHTAMVYTISGIVLHRLRRMAAACDAPDEARRVVERMVAEVERARPGLLPRGRASRPSSPTRRVEAARGAAGARRPGGARGLRQVARRAALAAGRLGRARARGGGRRRAPRARPRRALDDDEALALALDPARNRYRLDTLNVSSHAPLMRALDHAHYTFRKKLSPQRRLAGPAAPHGAGLAAAALAHRAGARRRGRAAS